MRLKELVGRVQGYKMKHDHLFCFLQALTCATHMGVSANWGPVIYAHVEPLILGNLHMTFECRSWTVKLGGLASKDPECEVTERPIPGSIGNSPLDDIGSLKTIQTGMLS